MCRVVKKILRPCTTNMVFCRVTPVSSPSISVCPRCSEPAAQIASLLIGAVTTASACPLSARLVAASIAAIADRPATASTLPHSSSPSTTPTSRMSITPASNRASSTAATGLISTSRPHTPTARRSTAASPTASPRASAAYWGSARVRAAISGPIPAGSPSVTASRGFMASSLSHLPIGGVRRSRRPPYDRRSTRLWPRTGAHGWVRQRAGDVGGQSGGHRPVRDPDPGDGGVREQRRQPLMQPPGIEIMGVEVDEAGTEDTFGLRELLTGATGGAAGDDDHRLRNAADPLGRGQRRAERPRVDRQPVVLRRRRGQRGQIGGRYRVQQEDIGGGPPPQHR